jgi:hypothetical protein
MKNNLVRTIDLAPTILNCFDGLPSPSVTDGNILDIFSVKEIVNHEKFSLAQVWLVGDKHKLVRYQKKVLADKKFVRPLKTFLSQETAYVRNYKLLRKYDRTGQLLAENFFLIKDGKLRTTKNNKYKSILRNFLSCYNNSADNVTGSGVRDVSEDIRNNLKDLGYKI